MTSFSRFHKTKTKPLITSLRHYSLHMNLIHRLAKYQMCNFIFVKDILDQKYLLKNHFFPFSGLITLT